MSWTHLLHLLAVGIVAGQKIYSFLRRLADLLNCGSLAAEFCFAFLFATLLLGVQAAIL